MLGSPIAHSKSPALHSAAYEVLGLPWSYDAIDVTGDRLADFVSERTDEWLGLSLTMPLKRDILPLLDSRDEIVELTGGANTVLFTDAGLSGFNTDVYGVTRALNDMGVTNVSAVQLLGAGATASSVLVAVAGLGASDVLVSARSPEKGASLHAVAERLGVRLTIAAFDGPAFEPDLVVSTLPGGSVVDVPFSAHVLAEAPLLDVAYDPWPTAIAARFLEADGRVISGLEMLVNQALAQVRLFLSGPADAPLPDERRVLDAMRASVGLALSVS